ncbi:glutamine amidotransferase [Aquimarina sp. AD10]|uniref:Glutamine amidotransferase n=1 Tax=Aquimarina aggregata TaxID=1642818 RepID=A0A162YAD5_9FLAO|nr:MULTISPECIES: DJ-1/PfpI family protein [Aquimarina]AXT60921.1 glutamine amidotransferase [Aquimarina sp. AD10]KZS39026.1 glutamine amidotransferase [Aquimarina aggregata]RKM95563.1 glutamine amidotransferase [Aquimarina sp. AD10]
MKKTITLLTLTLILLSCSERTKTNSEKTTITKIPIQEKITKKFINQSLPTIGILIFEGVIINEVVAPLDVFSNPTIDNKNLFNVITIAKENKTYNSAHGLKIIPDFVIEDIPELKVLVVPSSYNPTDQTSDEKLVNFVKEQNKSTDYIASHCAGAFLIGASGIANNKKIVTYVTGGKSLKENYPNLQVVDDNKISVIQDGKFISSNGSLVSYIASFDLLEKLTSTEHRKFVETSILFDRIKK